MNIFYNMQQNMKLRNKSQHHITILTLLFWVWKPLEKPVQQSDIDFIMRKYGTLQSLQIHPNLANAATRQNHRTNPRLNLNTPPARVYDPTIRPHTCESVRPYSCCTEFVRSVQQLYGIGTV